MPLYKAVKLAAEQPIAVNDQNGRVGPQYYMFGAPGSAACAAKAKTEGACQSPASTACWPGLTTSATRPLNVRRERTWPASCRSG